MAKLTGEAYCAAFYREHGLKYTTLRYFNVYGPGQSGKFVIPIFISRVVKGLPPIIYGNGSQSRAYTYITDAVNGTLLAAASDNTVGETFNIGNDEAITLTELAHYIIDICGNHHKPIFKNFGDGIRVEKREILKRQPDISKARRMLGFEAMVPWQNSYPTPYSPARWDAVRLQYNLTAPSYITIKVYDFAMDYVVTVCNAKYRGSSGDYHEIWDGTSARGEIVANGVYFYKLVKSGQGTAWGKIVILD